MKVNPSEFDVAWMEERRNPQDDYQSLTRGKLSPQKSFLEKLSGCLMQSEVVDQIYWSEWLPSKKSQALNDR